MKVFCYLDRISAVNWMIGQTILIFSKIKELIWNIMIWKELSLHALHLQRNQLRKRKSMSKQVRSLWIPNQRRVEQFCILILNVMSIFGHHGFRQQRRQVNLKFILKCLCRNAVSSIFFYVIVVRGPQIRVSGTNIIVVNGKLNETFLHF